MGKSGYELWGFGLHRVSGRGGGVKAGGDLVM
jgi:hypothetical protein